jgi:DNA-binding transcriptional LysR family regulator
VPSSRIDSRHLRYFVAVAEELNFRRAADRLHLAQPALTRQIKALEEAMQVKLLERNKHQVKLTSAGRVALDRGLVLLRDLDELVQASRRAEFGETGMLRIGFISFVAYEYLPQMLRAFRAAYPDVGIDLHEFLVMQQFETVLDGRVDVAVLRPLYEDPRIATKTIVRSRFVVALPNGHLLLKKKTVRMGELAGEEFITLPKRHGPSFHAQIMGFCSRAGFEPRIVREASDGQAVIGLVGAGMGVAVVPESVTKLNTAGVQYRLVTGLPETAEIVLAWRRDNTNQALKRFIQTAAKTMASGPNADAKKVSRAA